MSQKQQPGADQESRVIRTSCIFPNDVNNHNTLFGGRLMSHLDQVSSTSAARHSRRECVTASTDSVDFLHPVRKTDSVSFESYVTWTGTSSMEVFVKIIAETEEERKLHETAPDRARIRKERKQKSKELAAFLTANYPWEQYSSC
ncbi:hotdog domain-containing protein [Peribacillus simplex]|uniref:acyl-CoA thioesterase n=1 Tax=Peribacillus simplex TaxID=1478 RepID=UPI003265D3B3